MKISRVKKLFSIFFICSIIGACASHSRPTLYPNEVLKQRGPIIARADIDQCLREADVYFNTPEGKRVANGAESATSVGSSIGFGSGGVGLGVGIGSGNRVSGIDVKRGYVNQCLANKGYQVLAWD
jgi:outer membrane lipoprotein SlyB